MNKHERLKALLTRCKCCKGALSHRSPAASRNELATAIHAAPPLVALGPDSTDRLVRWGGGKR